MTYEIKKLYDGRWEFGLYPYALLKNGKVIAEDTNWNSPGYLVNLKKRLESGKKFNWITKFKARWLD